MQFLIKFLIVILRAEPGHDWFSQVSGEKCWDLMEQQYSAWTKPVHGGIANVKNGTKHKHDFEILKCFLIKCTDGHPGDLLHSPD